MFVFVCVRVCVCVCQFMKRVHCVECVKASQHSFWAYMHDLACADQCLRALQFIPRCFLHIPVRYLGCFLAPQQYLLAPREIDEQCG